MRKMHLTPIIYLFPKRPVKSVRDLRRSEADPVAKGKEPNMASRSFPLLKVQEMIDHLPSNSHRCIRA